jgi:hypothetical protein
VGIVFGRQETASLPEQGDFGIDRVDHQGAAVDQAGALDTADQGVAEQAGADALAGPIAVGCQ